MTNLKSIIAVLVDSISDPRVTYPKDVSGFSGAKVLSLLQRLTSVCCNENDSYLEIGVFQGLSLLSVAVYNPNVIVYGIDNFSQFDPDGTNINIVQKRVALNSLENVKLINSDYEDALEKLDTYVDLKKGKIGLFFVDGPHDYRSQLMCLELIRPYLADNSVIIIDDSNYLHVRQANRDFLVAHPEYKLIFEAYTGLHPQNMGEDQKQLARNGWWNGLNVIVHDPQDELQKMYPPTLRSRLVFENEHLTHASAYPTLVKDFVFAGQALMKLDILRFLKTIASILKNKKQSEMLYPSLYASMNTFSQNIVGERTNPSI